MSREGDGPREVMRPLLRKNCGRKEVHLVGTARSLALYFALKGDGSSALL